MICRCITWIKKHPVLSLFFLILMYLVIGATAPFYHYKPISQETQDTVSAENFYQIGREPGPRHDTGNQSERLG